MDGPDGAHRIEVFLGELELWSASFERAFNLQALDPQEQLDLQFFIGQLYLAEERYDDAIRTLEAWLRASGDAAAPAATP